ncbi:MAG: hypothetical protein JWM93_1835 [Frankiales bacterium]|nr:hypothetical protein [Frankiales bacterium]
MTESGTVPESGMATGNDATFDRVDDLPLDEAETQLLDVLRRTPVAPIVDDPVLLLAIRGNTVVDLGRDVGTQDDRLTPVFTEP